MVKHSPLRKKLFRDLWQRRGTLLALILILAVGVCSYIGMMGAYKDLDRARASYYLHYRLADFTIDLKRAPTAILPLLTSQPNIRQLRPRVTMDTMITLPNNNTALIPGRALSLPAVRRNVVNDVRMIHGTWFSAPYARETLINQQFAQVHHLHVGDRISVRFLDETRTVLIVGTVTSPEFTLILAPGTIAPDPGGFAILYMPFPLLQQYADLQGSFNQLLGMTYHTAPQTIHNTVALLAAQLDPYGVQLQTAQKDQTEVQILHDELTNIEKSVTVFPTMFLLVAILVLNMMVSRLVTQQRSAIGILKAVGYGNHTIIRHFLGFGCVVGLLGGLLGIALGYVLHYFFLVQYNMYFSIPHVTVHIYWGTYGIGMAISVISALLGASLGTYRATRLLPAEAIHPAPPEKTSHSFLERLLPLWTRLSFQWKMALRTVFRNPFRSMVTIIAAILATMLIVSALEFFDAMFEMVHFSFDKVQHQDYTLVLREPLGQEILQTVAQLPGVQHVETQLVVPATLQYGPYTKNTSIMGLDRSDTLYTPIDEQGKRVTIPSSGLVINQTLAHILHVKIGDTLRIRPLLGNRTETAIPITQIVKTYLGLAIYVPQPWLSRLLGNTYLTNQILFKLTKTADKKAFLRGIHQFFPTTNIISAQEAKSLFLSTLYEFMIFSAIIMIGFAGIIALGAALNTAMISFNERERDVASLRVLGLSNLNAAKIFFYESIMLNGIGIILGLVAGFYFTNFLSRVFSTEVYRMPVVHHPMRFLQSAGIMLLFILLTQLIIYYIIRKLRWLDILNIGE